MFIRDINYVAPFSQRRTNYRRVALCFIRRELRGTIMQVTKTVLDWVGGGGGEDGPLYARIHRNFHGPGRLSECRHSKTSQHTTV